MSRYKSNTINGQHQNGFSLVELMIAMAISMIAIAGVILLFSNSVKSNSDGLQHTRLNQELRAIMDVMARDIRRAGYWVNSDGTSNNPFQPLFKAVEINPAQNCITYLYQKDASQNETSNNNKFGFRLINNTVMLRQAGATCDDSTGWEAISDAKVITIDTLTFDLTDTSDARAKTYCTNLNTGVTTEGETCVGANPGDTLSTLYVVTISIHGFLAGDANVDLQLKEKVVVKNTVSQVAI